jgi:hypothetical protein
MKPRRQDKFQNFNLSSPYIHTFVKKPLTTNDKRLYLTDTADTPHNVRKCIKFFLLKTSNDIYPKLLTFIFAKLEGRESL